MKVVGLVLILAVSTHTATGQDLGQLQVEVRAGEEPVSGVEVLVAGATTTTDAAGVARLDVPAGATQVSLARNGFVSMTVSVLVVAGEIRRVGVQLEPDVSVAEEVIVVASTRSDRRIDDQPLRVEVLNREEIEEKMLMTPGDIVMLLSEMGGMRVQTTSPSLGGASVRIQGMRGRYTRFLSDGLPLYGSQPGGLGLLQTPPMDLGQVEVIKGMASALYGAGAMGGVVNLVSRRPGDELEREVLVNQSTRGATDGVVWLSSPVSDAWGMTLVGGGHRQEQTDADGDGWSDLAHYTRGIVRPRVFWDNGQGQSLFLTTGFTEERRAGGTQPGRVIPATGESYREGLETRRFDVGGLWQTVAGRSVVTARGTVARQWHDHQFGETLERDRHGIGFGEVTVRRAVGRHTWLVGLAVEHETYQPRDVPQFAYTFTTPGLFLQNDVDVRPWLALSMSGRVDRHNAYGWFASPRVSALLRSGEWSTRLSAGTGFVGPTPLTEETEAAGLARLRVDGPLRAERGRSVSVDLTRTQGPVSYTATLFAGRVVDPVDVDRSAYRLRNLDDPTTNVGLELLGLYRRAPIAFTASYTYVRARERVGGVVDDVAQTPRHSVGVVAMMENEDGRLGFELYYTGRQRVDANPYRTSGAPYTLMGLLAERRVGRLRLFVNLENLTDVRQQDWDPVIRPDRAVDGRWTVDGWAPLDGRIVNGGVRVPF
ncbi:MAG: TonB-dependent receptor [Acidobacteria bacterium]|nr:TonB-dependent receptor [Acidobacteriota bacterium]